MKYFVVKADLISPPEDKYFVCRNESFPAVMVFISCLTFAPRLHRIIVKEISEAEYDESQRQAMKLTTPEKTP